MKENKALTQNAVKQRIIDERQDQQADDQYGWNNARHERHDIGDVTCGRQLTQRGYCFGRGYHWGLLPRLVAA